MARPERALDPEANPLARFAHDLRQLRRRAGTPSYRSMAARAHYAATSLSRAASGDELPTLELTLAYVWACDGDALVWKARWENLAASLRPPDPVTRPEREAPEPPPPPTPAPAVTRHPLTLLASGTAVCLTAVVAVVGWYAASSTPPDTLAAATHITTQTPTPTPPRPAVPSPSTGTLLVAGTGCPANGTTTTPDTSTGSRSGGWREIQDGWHGDGCTGTAGWTMTTGDPNNWDATYTWTFPTGGAATCAVDIYVPQSPYAGGVTAYDVYGAVARGQQDSTASFTIDQRSHPGQWATAGTFHTPDAVLQINLANRSPSVAVYPVTASAARATCH